jgi:hypothetical protein
MSVAGASAGVAIARGVLKARPERKVKNNKKDVKDIPNIRFLCMTIIV